MQRWSDRDQGDTHKSQRVLRVSMEVHICPYLSVCVGEHVRWGEEDFSSMNYA